MLVDDCEITMTKLVDWVEESTEYNDELPVNLQNKYKINTQEKELVFNNSYSICQINIASKSHFVVFCYEKKDRSAHGRRWKPVRSPAISVRQNTAQTTFCDFSDFYWIRYIMIFLRKLRYLQKVFSWKKSL